MNRKQTISITEKNRHFAQDLDALRKLKAVMIANGVFFGLFGILFFYESELLGGELIMMVDLSIIFLPVYFLYLIVYGFCSVWYTNLLLMCQEVLFFFLTVFFTIGLFMPFHFMKSPVPKVEEAIVLVAASVGLSFGCGLIAKVILLLKNRITKNEVKENEQDQAVEL